jgi:hypothetical protein
MIPSFNSNVRGLARHLMDLEPGDGCDAIIQVCEKLRTNLNAILGVVGFRTLLHRALVLTVAENKALENASVHHDGSLRGFEEFAACSTQKQIYTAGEALIGRLLFLVEILIGQALTRKLLEDIWSTPRPKSNALKAVSP